MHGAVVGWSGDGMWGGGEVAPDQKLPSSAFPVALGGHNSVCDGALGWVGVQGALFAAVPA